MRIPRETIDAIRENTDIAQVVQRFVTLKRAGNSWKGLCPFHQEKTPSFHVIPHKNIFHCFGCGAGGDAFKFLMQLQGMSFIESVKELAGPAGITIEERELSQEDRQRLRRKQGVREACDLAAGWFHANLMAKPEGADARSYLKDRGITRETCVRFRLGFAPDGWTHLLDHLEKQGVSPQLAVRAGLARVNERRQSSYDMFRDRLIIPILDDRERPVAFGGRIMKGDGPKYINSPETEIYEKSKTLYGLSHARAPIQRSGRAILVEGYFDVISLAQAGFEDAIATCGTALTPEHCRRLRRLTDRVLVLFDGDSAGTRAADRSLPLFLEAGMDARRIDLPGAKDPDEYVQKEGGEAFEKRLGSARPLLEDFLHRKISEHGHADARAVREALPLLRRVPADARSLATSRAAGILGVDEATLRRALSDTREEQQLAGGGGARWVGNIELNHLIWLLIHLPDSVSGVVGAADPDIVTDRDDVRAVLGALLDGQPLVSALDGADPDVQRVFQASAAREGLYTEDNALDAATKILARLELRGVEAELSAVRRELSGCEPTLDGPRYRELLSRRAEIQKRGQRLKKLVGPRR
ncbi:MAG: DNA primase [Proteobacteria bacterium]|nr:DNA primase [Pseudomonadota bacterium]